MKNSGISIKPATITAGKPTDAAVQEACCVVDEKESTNSLCDQVWQVWQEHAQHLRRFLQQRTREQMLTDDLLSEVMLKVYKNCEQLAEVRDMRSWLTRIAHNALTDHYRKPKTRELQAVEVLKHDSPEGI